MIFSDKKELSYHAIQMILDGQKTETRRIVKFNDWGFLSDHGNYVKSVPGNDPALGRVKWQVGRDYAVVPKRGQPTAIYDPETKIYCPPYTFSRNGLLKNGYIPLRIKLLEIRQENLHDITEKGALAEGVGSIDDYKTLWEAINGPGSWHKNPMVWVLRFEVLNGDN